MKKSILLIFAAISLIMVSCELLNNLETPTDEPTENQVIQGLKRALEIGTDSATSVLAVTNGYYGDQLVKILLPEEALNVQANVNKIINAVPLLSSVLDLDKHFENVVQSINRAAENAAHDASPIFKDAITGMSLTDSWDILKGINPLASNANDDFDSTSATGYFQMTTSPALTSLYGQKIDQALDIDLGLGFSANTAWNTLRNTYNAAINSITSNPLTNLAYSNSGYKLDPIQTESIGEHCTEKALNGLFLKVGNEEKKIRKNPLDWADEIIQKVFNYAKEQFGS